MRGRGLERSPVDAPVDEAKPWGCTTADGEMPFHEPFDSFDPASPAHQSTLPYCKRKTSRLDPLYILYIPTYIGVKTTIIGRVTFSVETCVHVFSLVFSRCGFDIIGRTTSGETSSEGGPALPRTRPSPLTPASPKCPAPAAMTARHRPRQAPKPPSATATKPVGRRRALGCWMTRQGATGGVVGRIGARCGGGGRGAIRGGCR